MRPVQIPEQSTNHLASPFVQIAGRLIGQQILRSTNQRPRQHDSLLLAAGQLARPMMSARPQTNFVQTRHRLTRRFGVRHPTNQQRHHYILFGRKLRKQVVNLPNKTNFPIPELGKLSLRQRLQVSITAKDLAL